MRATTIEANGPAGPYQLSILECFYSVVMAITMKSSDRRTLFFGQFRGKKK